MEIVIKNQPIIYTAPYNELKTTAVIAYYATIVTFTLDYACYIL